VREDVEWNGAENHWNCRDESYSEHDVEVEAANWDHTNIIDVSHDAIEVIGGRKIGRRYDILIEPPGCFSHFFSNCSPTKHANSP
jgi:hypothetical protein